MKKVRIGVLGAYRSILAGGVPMQIPNPPTNPNLNHLNFHQHVHLSYITP